MQTFCIASTWDGRALDSKEHITLSLEHPTDTILTVTIEAPFYNDPAPSAPVGHTDALWNYEVVEWFVIGPEDANGQRSYIEFEWSPHGHHLVLCLHGERNIVGYHTELEYTAQIKGSRWTGQADIPVSWLPKGTLHHNAYAIHGGKGARVYSAMSPVPGDAPDFHRLANSVVWKREELRSV